MTGTGATAPEAQRWLAELEAPDGPSIRPAPHVLSPAELAARLDLLAVPDADREAVAATMPGPAADPALWRALTRCRATLAAAPGTPVHWPNAPAALGPAGRYFYVHVYLTALPDALDAHRRLGVPEDVTRATFADLGEKLRLYRLAHGLGGFDRQAWLVRHFRGTLFRLGRLQFDRARLDAAGYGGTPDGGGPADGEPVLEVHVPGDGPLTPEACADSYGRARTFFARHFPAERYAYATCRSWLLDDQLAAYLPPASNIIRFQRRHRLFGAHADCDDDVLGFVFHLPPGTSGPPGVRGPDGTDHRPDLDRLPQDSTLQRAITAHLRSGRHWRLRCGWTTLP
ncbi:acyltransferase domain-containing protein [Actinacidiphila acidipaludis]|uniref:Acyltransferase domain-containing protein n=1 Tax=Actinacidiphila acidipaludis TaxID=2873382 RepID=A0ABS7QAZ3_9ACTN|nr:acyltransferase domain-containing protein [Streptomyces acidipaludis]MBY8880296.1 acyltransferase domain-containing protein [Streptomyces acidipaludis]